MSEETTVQDKVRSLRDLLDEFGVRYVLVVDDGNSIVLEASDYAEAIGMVEAAKAKMVRELARKVSE